MAFRAAVRQPLTNEFSGVVVPHNVTVSDAIGSGVVAHNAAISSEDLVFCGRVAHRDANDLPGCSGIDGTHGFLSSASRVSQKGTTPL